MRLPAATTTGPSTTATFGSLLLTVTVVGATAGADSTVAFTVGCPPAALNTFPSCRCASTTTPTGLAITGGMVPGAGVPTPIVSSRVSFPARNVSVADPSTPATMVTLAKVAPAAITTGSTTVATLG